ncbi:hypothetical protein BH11ACT4_BH11ACT4_20640 [soil metagenome]
MRRASTAFALALSGVIACVVVGIVVPGAEFVAGCFALGALVLGLVIATPRQRVLAGILVSLGLAALGTAWLLGGRLSIGSLFTLNQDLIAMLAAASFVGMLARDAPAAEPRLRGAAAVWRTAGVVHFTGSVINMSVVTIVGDRLKRGGTLRTADVMILTRGYATGAFWSPLWAGTAAAVSFAPTANLAVIIPIGIVLALAVLAASMVTVFRALGDELPDYRGYALSWELLRLPVVLMIAVVAAHLLFPSSPVPRIVALASLAIAALVLVSRQPSSAFRAFARQARDGLPALRGEVTLFVSAGVLAIGLGALLSVGHLSLHLPEYDVPVAWLSIVATVLLALVGVHPIISMGIIAAMVAPLHPQGSLFALSAMIGWGVGAATGPISGLQLYLGGRYGIDGLATTRQNLPYVAVALLLAWPALFAVSALTGR